MMAKITSGSDFKGAVNYIMDDKKDAKLIAASGVRYKDKDSIIRSFICQSRLNPKKVVCVGHVSLDFSAQDKDDLTNEKMLKIAGEYLQKMKIVNTQYIIVRHFDKPHPHIHICYNRIDNDGKTIEDGNERRRSTAICKELTKKYGLYFASGKENVNLHRLKEPDKSKYEVYGILSEHVPLCKNWQQLIDVLNKKGIQVKFKYKGETDEIQGITFLKNGYSFNGSKVDRMFSYSKINNQLEYNNKSDQRQNRQTQYQGTSSNSNTFESALEDIKGSGLINQHGEDFEEIEFAHRMQSEEKERQWNSKKKKKSKGIG
ncbi:relaxase/mobilization nuclease domain-containing protein [Dysgonomonas sp. HDW5B]|uniref:relaxase/mobilization nuclease domain-containing protein n=1 Tax=Dysgonomonas sp. HDW5B TaxID=2714927 RepID=UPI001407C6C9|nr:relaxase/mobilization nuclease domain-containing protein [Dysgonomonas sp. HDW5B]QIK53125.1 relaxase/mobilization nuclease domain-containing protein [Dysgonomonas sp. HDW5B]